MSEVPLRREGEYAGDGREGAAKDVGAGQPPLPLRDVRGVRNRLASCAHVGGGERGTRLPGGTRQIIYRYLRLPTPKIRVYMLF